MQLTFIKTLTFRIIFTGICLLTLGSCSTLYYSKDKQFQDPNFTQLKNSDTISVLLVQYSDISESSEFINKLYSLCANNTTLKTIKSEVISSRLIKDKVLALPKNINTAVLEIIKPNVPTEFLLTVNVTNWKEAEYGSSGDFNRDGKLAIQFSLYNISSLKLLYSIPSSMLISLPDKNDNIFSLTQKHGFDKTSTELIQDTFMRELMKIFPKK